MKKQYKFILLLCLCLLPISTMAVMHKGVFRIANYAEPSSLDPHLATGVPEMNILFSLAEGLVSPDPKTAMPLPALAKSWKLGKDGKTYTFYLRKATFSDGVPITAQTFVDSWLRILDPKTGSSYAWFPMMFIEGGTAFNKGKVGPEGVKIKALDKYTFQMTATTKAPYVLAALTHYSFTVVPLHAIKKHGKDWTLPRNFVGSGPFVVKSWIPQNKLSVIPNSKYWDKENVHLEEIIYYPIAKSSTEYTKYMAGEVDWVTYPPVDMIDELLEREDFQFGPALQTEWYFVQTKIPPFNDPRVRKALSMAIDRQSLVEKVRGGGEIATGAAVPSMAGYTPVIGNLYNPTAAKKLLAEAGFPDGKGFPEFELMYNTNEAHRKNSEYVQQEWEKNLGITVTLVNEEWKSYLSKKDAGDFKGIARGGWLGDYPDPNTFLELFTKDSSMNGGKFYNARFDELISKAANMKGGKDRYEILQQCEKILIDEEQAIIPLYYNVHQHVIDTGKWGGWHHNVMDQHPTKTIYLKK